MPGPPRNRLNKSLRTLRSALLWPFIQAKAQLKADEWGLVCPYGIGDLYLVCGLAKSFLATHGGRIVLVVKRAQADIPKLFPQAAVRVVVDERIQQLVPPRAKPNILKQGHCCVAHLSFLRPDLKQRLGNHFTLLDTYRTCLELPSRPALSVPQIAASTLCTAEQRFEHNGCRRGKTVILYPGAYSTATLPMGFWNKLVAELKNQDFQVYTHVADHETPIAGTRPMFIPLLEAIPMAELAGWVIAVRSGICDLLSSSNARLSVVYPRQNWFAGTVFSGSSLRVMGLSRHAEEYEMEKYENDESLIAALVHHP